MEEEVPGAAPAPAASGNPKESKESIRVKRKTLQTVLDQCQRALESLGNNQELDEDDDDEEDGVSSSSKLSYRSSIARRNDTEAYELCNLLKSRLECPDFVEKIESAQVPCPQTNAEEGSSWDLVSDNDLWEGGNLDVDKEDYVLVRQEDVVEGIACFMAAYLASLKETKELSPDQLQEALGKTFSVNRKKGKLPKAWDGSKVIYNVASWGATAIGIYQNPILFNAAAKAFWTSCHVISNFL